jgi:hypothetical protein
VDLHTVSIPQTCVQEGAARTPDTGCRAYVHFHGRFLWHFIAARDLDGPVDGADERVAVVRVCRGAVGAIEVCECYVGERHSGMSCVGGVLGLLGRNVQSVCS